MITVTLYYAVIGGGLFNETEANLEYEENGLDGFVRVLTKDYDYEKLTDGQICEMMFMHTNDGKDNPLSNPQRQEFIKKNKLHTSLSIGDIVQITRDGKQTLYMCKGIGWKTLEIKQ